MSDDVDRLIERLRNHDSDALAEYIRRHEAQLLAFIGKRMSESLRKKVEPGDILQDLSLSCLSALEQVDFENRDPFRWLCQQAERRIIDEHRRHFGAQKRAAHREIEIYSSNSEGDGTGIENLLVASLTSPSHAFSKAQQEYHLLTAIQQLSEVEQSVLKMRYLQGMPSKDIAAEIGKSDAATRVLLSRSLKKLQELLSENEEFRSLRRPADESLPDA